MSKEIRSSSDWLLWQTGERQPASLGRLEEGLWRQGSRQCQAGPEISFHWFSRRTLRSSNKDWKSTHIKEQAGFF